MKNIGENAKEIFSPAMRKNRSACMLWDVPCPFLRQQKYAGPVRVQSGSRKCVDASHQPPQLLPESCRLWGLLLVLLLFFFLILFYF